MSIIFKLLFKLGLVIQKCKKSPTTLQGSPPPIDHQLISTKFTFSLNRLAKKLNIFPDFQCERSWLTSLFENQFHLFSFLCHSTSLKTVLMNDFVVCLPFCHCLFPFDASTGKSLHLFELDYRSTTLLISNFIYVTWLLSSLVPNH